MSYDYNAASDAGYGIAALSGVMLIFAFSKNINYVGPTVNGDIDFNNLF